MKPEDIRVYKLREINEQIANIEDDLIVLNTNINRNMPAVFLTLMLRLKLEKQRRLIELEVARNLYENACLFKACISD